MGVARLVAIVAVAVGAGVAIHAEWTALRQGLGGLAHTRVGWVPAGMVYQWGGRRRPWRPPSIRRSVPVTAPAEGPAR